MVLLTTMVLRDTKAAGVVLLTSRKATHYTVPLTTRSWCSFIDFSGRWYNITTVLLLELLLAAFQGC